MPHPWEVGNHSQRWKGYVHPVYDLTLRNKLDPDAKTIRTPSQLVQAEEEFVEARSATLATSGIPATYDLAGLRAVHQHLFQDVYEWAGDLRTVQTGRRDSPDFVWFDKLEGAIEKVSQTIRDTNLLRDIPSSEYPDALADVYSRINHAHIFREGNGRTQRAFVTALAAESGRRVDWTVLPTGLNDVASLKAMQGDHGPLRDMFALALHNPETRAGEQAWEARRIASALFPDPPTARRQHPSVRPKKAAISDDDYWVRERRHLGSRDRGYGRE